MTSWGFPSANNLCGYLSVHDRIAKPWTRTCTIAYACDIGQMSRPAKNRLNAPRGHVLAPFWAHLSNPPAIFFSANVKTTFSHSLAAGLSFFREKRSFSGFIASNGYWSPGCHAQRRSAKAQGKICGRLCQVVGLPAVGRSPSAPPYQAYKITVFNGCFLHVPVCYWNSVGAIPICFASRGTMRSMYERSYRMACLTVNYRDD